MMTSSLKHNAAQSSSHSFIKFLVFGIYLQSPVADDSFMYSFTYLADFSIQCNRGRDKEKKGKKEGKEKEVLHFFC